MELKSINRSKEFIPEWRDNRKQKIEDQVKIHFKRFISSGEYGLYKTYAMKSGSVEVIYKDIELIVAHVDRIENLSIGGVAIDTPVKLCDFEDIRMHSLITEIRKHLTKGEEIEPGE